MLSKFFNMKSLANKPFGQPIQEYSDYIYFTIAFIGVSMIFYCMAKKGDELIENEPNRPKNKYDPRE